MRLKFSKIYASVDKDWKRGNIVGQQLLVNRNLEKEDHL
jgi:hypothetical protein